MSPQSTWRPAGRSGSQRSVFASIAAPVLLVAVAGLIGWLVLISIKWLIVAILFALGAALIIVPSAGWRRFLGSQSGPGRSHRVGQLVTAVSLGAALIVLAFVVSRHGWLLIVVPVLVVLIGRAASRFNEWRAARSSGV